MHIIPVIDLLEGRVVRAVRGDRSRYRPIESSVCPGSEPVPMALRLCEHCATGTLYVADLDALQGRPAQIEVLRGLLDALPQIELWLDAGFADAAAAEALLGALGTRRDRVTPVYGSESLASREALARCFAPPSHALLSLDSRGGAPLDAAGVRAAPSLWPRRVIVMTLERVGSAEGPDLAAFDAVRRAAPRAELIGAGGIRDEADLAACEAAGARAWLVASALHDGAIAPRRRATECGAAEPPGHTVSPGPPPGGSAGAASGDAASGHSAHIHAAP
jgi:phosphoribosylformimino-5-aminoimidazole carboxamide ribotide isomerase